MQLHSDFKALGIRGADNSSHVWKPGWRHPGANAMDTAITTCTPKTIVLIHHTGFAFDCSISYALWDNEKDALGDDPFAWYGGHVHSSIVYSEKVNIPVSTY